MATIKDVAKKAGVSPTTVSRVLNNTAPVNEKTKKRVLAVIKELNYTPNLLAQGMRTKRSKIFGIVIPDYRNSFYHHLFHYLELEAKKQGYHILVSSTGEMGNIKETVEDLIYRNVDGLIICTYQGESTHIDALLDVAKDIPMVFMDHLITDQPVNMVYTDGYQGIYKITQLLIDLGHKRIGFIKPIPNYQVASDRYTGYLEALQDASIEIDEQLFYEGDYSLESGYQAAEYFLKELKSPPTAIISSTDLMAMGAMKYIQARGLQIPKDIAISGFDNLSTSELVTPSLTTYHQPVEQMAEVVISILMNQLANPNTKARKVMLEGTLIVRNSTHGSK
ncbi:MAG: LacI family transcriptional regulator [Epulopiscium sp.]|nr:LacI family transcriptional regulator [Candidatus Epulonipiscium sp.]